MDPNQNQPPFQPQPPNPYPPTPAPPLAASPEPLAPTPAPVIINPTNVVASNPFDTPVAPNQPGPVAPNVAYAQPLSQGTPQVVVSPPQFGDPIGPVVGSVAPTTPLSPPPSRKWGRKPLWGGLAALLIFGGAAAFYFGYYTNASVIYSQALGNTGKGYNKLVSYVDTQSKQQYKGYTGTGSYSAAVKGGASSDGHLAFKSDGQNSELTFDLGLAVTRLTTNVRLLKSSGSTPDIYLKATGLKGLGTTMGSPTLDPTFAKLDGNWIVIDHTLLDNISSLASQQSAAIKAPTRSQVLNEARALGKVNQQYVFSTNKDKAVTQVVQKHGIETINGHKTYHYTVALQKAAIKKYITAQRDALKASTLYSWVKQNNYQSMVDSSYTSLEQSANNIKASDTFDVWADVNQRMIYKIRVNSHPNPVDNFVDIGLDYKGGDNYPFFISGQSKSGADVTTFNLTTTINTKSSGANLKLAVESGGQQGSSVKANFNLQPSNASVHIDKPANAEQLSQVLSELGLGDLLSQLQGANLGSQSKATDTKRQADILSIQTQLEAAFSQNGSYPTLAEMNNASWRSKNMPGFDDSALTDPAATTAILAGAPAAHVYAYQPVTAAKTSCTASGQCQSYTLTATLSDGKPYAKTSLD